MRPEAAARSASKRGIRMKKRLLGVVAIPLVLMLSSCFSLQSFSLLNGALAPGGLTKAQFVVRPASTVKNSFSKLYQFVLVGVDTPSDVSVGKATWGVNKKFGGPQNMPVSSVLPTSIGTDCDTTGFTFSGISSTLTWKGFVTLNPMPDHQAVTQKSVIQVVVKAKGTATHQDTVTVVGLTGAWLDDGDGIVNAPDTFACTGNASTSLFII
jgi:hypothetical protein